jgi:hypothetical protein
VSEVVMEATARYWRPVWYGLEGHFQLVFWVSGWAMLEQIAKGETDVEVMVKEVRGALRKKETQLREANPVGSLQDAF